jgi:hypothetical protein
MLLAGNCVQAVRIASAPSYQAVRWSIASSIDEENTQLTLIELAL